MEVLNSMLGQVVSLEQSLECALSPCPLHCGHAGLERGACPENITPKSEESCRNHSVVSRESYHLRAGVSAGKLNLLPYYVSLLGCI